MFAIIVPQVRSFLKILFINNLIKVVVKTKLSFQTSFYQTGEFHPPTLSLCFIYPCDEHHSYKVPYFINFKL